MKDFNESTNNEIDQIRDQISRYFTFWPFFITSILFLISLTFIFIRYSEKKYESSATIQILDEAQDTEMALPTELTVFNRSMVNLENEIGILKSYSLNAKVVEKLKSHITFHIAGKVITSQYHFDTWSENLNFEYKPDFNFDDYESEFEIQPTGNDNLLITNINSEKVYKFENLTTKNIKHNLPFDITFKSNDEKIRFIKFNNKNKTIEYFKKSIDIFESGLDSDQLLLKISSSNKKIAREYLNTLINEFDIDGIKDKQIQYKSTIDFVDKRSALLGSELEVIELKKQDFKKTNNLSDLKSDASINIQEKFQYSNELFSTESQKRLSILIEQSLKGEGYELLPLNIGLENLEINSSIYEYNSMVSEREKYLISAGPNNSLVLNINKQLDYVRNNIIKILENYQKSLDLKISNLREKEKEFISVYNNVPENEKVLRSIERELSIKEALFLLLLQKREEASINFAVVKPTIKVIDYARTDPLPIYPRPITFYGISIISGFLIPFIFIFIKFYFDKKIHTRKDLQQLLSEDQPIIGEIPHIQNISNSDSLDIAGSRNTLDESIRMLIANLNFSLFSKKQKNYTILTTSSVKGEGKTLISVNSAKILSEKFKKVLLIGADLRNPQIHKYFNKDKNIQGLTDCIINSNLKWQDCIYKNEKFDILFSGTIPPNPTQILSSENFKLLLNQIKLSYECIVIDSAPCLLVSDTLEISELTDTTLYAFRSNYTSKDVLSFINESTRLEKLKNMSIVLNGVGNSSGYGYKYGYQYGYNYNYKYGYQYGYNYGYGYGYSEEKK